MADVVIIGAGLAGASAAWHLTRAGHSVTVLERTTPANPVGSSHGSARILRYAYPEQLYCDLVVRARAGWDELERASGQMLITTTGCVDFGDLRGPVELAAVLSRAGVEHELLSAEEATGRWPQIAFDTAVLWHPGAGVIDAERTVAAMLTLAEESGHARVLTHWEATGFERTGSGLRVRSATGETVEGSHIIVAVGGWLPDLMGGLGLPPRLVAAMPPLIVQQEQVFHFPYRRGGAPPWPTFIHTSSDMLAYGLPGGRDADFRGLKVAEYNGGRAITSAAAQDGLVSDANRRQMTAYVKAYLPGLDTEPYAEATCLFTNTPTEDFVIDAADDVVILSACSGHGAKFAPLLGELAGDLALGVGTVPAEFRLTTRA